MTDTDKKLQLDSILPDLKVTTLKRVYQALARQAAEATGLDADALFDRLMSREQKATSGMGGGVAIPHLQVKGLKKPFALFARIAHLVDFDAVDDEPVDLVFLLLSPESEDSSYHLRRLAHVSRVLRDAGLCRLLRGTDDIDILQAFFLDTENYLMAA